MNALMAFPGYEVSRVGFTGYEGSPYGIPRPLSEGLLLISNPLNPPYQGDFKRKCVSPNIFIVKQQKSEAFRSAEIRFETIVV